MFMLLTRKGSNVRRLYNVGAATVIAPNRKDMKPHLVDAEAAKAEVVSLKERLKATKVANSKDKKIEMLEIKIGEQEKTAREAQSKADAIDAAVSDLKAVN